jgi:membrane-associated phospholipid phosphatase
MIVKPDRQATGIETAAGGDTAAGQGAGRLRPADHVLIAYLAIEALLIVAFARAREPHWPFYLVLHAVMIAAIPLLARAAARTSNLAVTLLRDWYPALYIGLIFKQLKDLVPAVHPAVLDDMLLSWDRALFGDHPGAYLDAVASPLLTEILRACWLSYFIMPFLVAVPLYRRRDPRAFNETVLVLVLGWLISFLGYFAVPAQGPGYFPDVIPAPDCIRAEGATRSVALALFSLEGHMHDVFPSGHTIIALLALRQAARHRLKGWFLLVPVVAGLLVATVYLRYHYGVDIIAGFIVATGVLLAVRLWIGRSRDPISRAAA